MKTYPSRWHKWTRAVRVARRLAYAGLDCGNETNYRRYLWLVDKGCKGIRFSETPCLAVQCVRVRGYITMRRMGWRDLRESV